MQQINNVTTLIKLAKVSKLTIETLPQILRVMTENKILLKEQALAEVLSLLKSAPSAITVAYETIQNSTQKANGTNDKQSLEYIKELLTLFKSAGVSDKRIAKLLKQIEQHEHEIRLERNKGTYSFAKWALLSVTTIVVAVITKAEPKKYPFWYK